MAKHLQREVENLKKMLLTLCGKVEENLFQAVHSVKNHDAIIAQKIIETDDEIDQMEVEIEEECLKILALHQPVAIDLRFIITAMKINNDLERIGDLTVNIAERSVFLAGQNHTGIPFDFEQMATKTQLMVKQSIDSLVNMDCNLAFKVCQEDDQVDAINSQIYEQFKDQVQTNPDQVNHLLHLLSISRHLERIADHATNIAEDVIYMANGQIVRHRTEEYKA
ncbi:MAG: phosphate signaling complex protein PhoU [Phycisphaerae bacterium]|nr:phosphate signaling complex protein PhoU [Phycisphaerae bacterium]